MNGEIGDLHIDDFCRDTAKILIALYKSFPVKTTLYVEDFAGPDQPDEFGLHSPRFEAGFSALLWLRETDYMTFSGTIRQEAVEDAVLSHRCFCFLSSPGGKLSEEGQDNSAKKRIDKLHGALRSATSEQLKALILQFMNESRIYR